MKIRISNGLRVKLQVWFVAKASSRVVPQIPDALRVSRMLVAAANGGRTPSNVYYAGGRAQGSASLARVVGSQSSNAACMESLAPIMQKAQLNIITGWLNQVAEQLGQMQPAIATMLQAWRRELDIQAKAAFIPEKLLQMGRLVGY